LATFQVDLLGITGRDSMSDATLKTDEARGTDSREEPITRQAIPGNLPAWETPKMEDVSQQVMAQPYIRFT
jgi:hypothetical protein